MGRGRERDGGRMRCRVLGRAHDAIWVERSRGEEGG